MQWILAQHYKPVDIAAAFTWTTLLGIDREMLSRTRLFQGHFYGPLEQVTGTHCNVFTILRDPIERALSHYGHVFRDEKHYLHQRAHELGTLDAYLEDRTTQMTISNFQSRMLAMDFDVQTFYSNMTPEERRRWRLEQHMETTDFGLTGDQIFSAAQAKLDSFFLVGITEKFPATLALLCHKLGWKYPMDSSAQNINVERPRQTELAEHTLRRLRELNSVDIALYTSACNAFELAINNLLIDTVNKNSHRGLFQRFIT